MPTAPGATTVHLCLTPERYSNLQNLAANAGMSVRQYISCLVNRHSDTHRIAPPRIVEIDPVAHAPGTIHS